MKRQQFYDEQTHWQVNIYYVVTRLDADEILHRLAQIGCNGQTLVRAEQNLSLGKCDTGLTYTNRSTRQSVVVIARTSCALEFMQSLTHELGHLANHIAQANNIALSGEEVRYVCDRLIEYTWPISRELLCDCCRNQ